MSYEFFIEYGKKNYKTILIISILTFFLLMTTLFGKTEIIEEEILMPVLEEEIIEIKPEPIYVDIKGAVHTPGVYQVNENERVIDVIKLAGGLIYLADTNQVNLSQKISDQMIIFIPIEGEEVEEYFESAKKVYEDDGLLSLNEASLEQLMALPGIGEVKAQEIIRYRDQFGFEEIEDLLKVSGIGPATFNQIKDLLKL